MDPLLRAWTGGDTISGAAAGFSTQSSSSASDRLDGGFCSGLFVRVALRLLFLGFDLLLLRLELRCLCPSSSSSLYFRDL